MTTIELDQVEKQYGKAVALDPLNLRIAGGMIGLLGPNGAGKTTLIRLLTGFLRPDAGSVRVAGHAVASDQALQALRRELGYVPQKLAFYPAWTVREFVDYIAQLKGLHDASARATAVTQSLERVGLAEQAAKKTEHLSGGMARRLGIAQAIVNDPRVLIVDEPTAGLDPEERMRFRQLLSGLGQQRLVLFSTHIVEDIAQTCQQVIILKQSIRYAGPINRLLADTDASGQIWEIHSAAPLDDPALTVVSSTVSNDGYLSRVLGQPAPAYAARSVASTLEEAYAWTVRQPSAA